MTYPDTTLDPAAGLPSADAPANPVRHKQRKPIAVIGLNVITLGIYSIYWWYSINRELRDLGEVFEDPELENRPWLAALAFAFGALAFIVPLVWTAVTTSRRIRSAGALLGIRAIDVDYAVGLVIAALLLGLIGLVGVGWMFLGALGLSVIVEIAFVVYMQKSVNAIWDAYEAKV